ncbi:MAG: T9SS type A sorting domain-containing protein, partial [Candidatus Latescibacteria bacterium]|nr:T9SS type A sorting domain-containing protein [Candidatus Latescibacterota bacterium]
FSIRNPLCYPNPMNSETVFTYELTQPAQQVKVKVFSISGRLIDEFEGEITRGYNRAPRGELSWISPVPLANGVYLYKIIAKNSDGKKAEVIEKLSVLR